MAQGQDNGHPMRIELTIKACYSSHNFTINLKILNLEIKIWDFSIVAIKNYLDMYQLYS